MAAGSLESRAASPARERSLPRSVEFRINNFDLLRIFAATQVLLFHATGMLQVSQPIWIKMLSPFAGVPIFFVVSGYLVSASYERQEEVLSYIRNRLFRIYPGLWVCLLATLVTVLVIGYRMQHVKDFTWFPIQLFGVIFTPKFLQHFGVGSYNGALWTIPIELQFYFVLPVVYSLLGLKKRRGNKLLYAAFGIWTALTLLLYYADPTLLPKYSFSSTHHRLVETLLIHSFVPTFYMFFFGVVLHRTHIFSRKAVAGKGIIWLAVYVMFHLSLARFQGSPVFVILSNLFLGVTAISMAYTLPKLSQFLLRGQDISYGVYIYHCLIVNVLLQLGMKGRLPNVLEVLALAYIIGITSWTLVEKPALRRKDRMANFRSRRVETTAELNRSY